MSVDYILQQRINKRKSDVLLNKNKISRLQTELEHSQNDLWKRQLKQKINQLIIENEILERKIRQKYW